MGEDEIREMARNGTWEEIGERTSNGGEEEIVGRAMNERRGRDGREADVCNRRLRSLPGIKEGGEWRTEEGPE
jgi:hypothetical protein